MSNHVTREPLIELLHQMLTGEPTLSVIGQRGASRNCLAWARYPTSMHWWLTC